MSFFAYSDFMLFVAGFRQIVEVLGPLNDAEPTKNLSLRGPGDIGKREGQRLGERR